MSTTVKTGWLNDKNGDKFAPKTLTSQIQTSDGILLEDKIQTDIQAAKEDILTGTGNIDNKIFEHNESTTAHGNIRQLVNNFSELLNEYILNIDYDTLLAFDINEIIINNNAKTSILGQAILGQMVLA